MGGHKNTPANVKMTLEVVGSKGRVVVDNAGDGRNEAGEWTGTYTATATMWDENDEQSTITPSDEYINRITPPQPVRNLDGESDRVRTTTQRVDRFRSDLCNREATSVLLEAEHIRLHNDAH